MSLYKNNNPSEEFIKIKHRGKIYTPDYLVNIILNQGHYVSGSISQRHVIDNSCGDGQFMIHVVDRYCEDYLSRCNNLDVLKEELETYIHAVDIDSEEVETCKDRCSKVASLYGITDVAWNFICANSLSLDKFDGAMDFVVGNPPYVRVHNLDETFDEVKKFSFGNGGMTDLYIVFYEVGLRMLKPNGILCYITPSSFFTSLAGTNMRHYLITASILESVCDLKHFQPFNAITYTTIICLNKTHKQTSVAYYEFDEQRLLPKFIDTLEISDYWIKQEFYFSSKNNLKLLRKIFDNERTSDISIKNGFATLADKCFIRDFDFESKYIIPVLKASRAKWTKIFYPYDNNAQLIPEEEIKKDGVMYEYLLSQKEALTERDNEKDANVYWYAFGRSQAISDTYRDKLSINALIRTSADLKLVDVPAGCGVYSGLYIISQTTPISEIKESLEAEDFGIYISLLGKYKSGGYYTFSSKDVKYYLDYKLGKEEKDHAQQYSIFDCY